MFKKWIWKEDTNSLEQVSTGLQLSDKQMMNFRKIKKSNKSGIGKGFNNVANLTSKKCKRQKTNSKASNLRLHATENRAILLDDVKRVAYDLMVDLCEFAEGFEETLKNNQFDNLLEKLLIYFDVFFDKVALDEKTNEMDTELSSLEKKAYSAITTRIEGSQRSLAEQYCILILGLDTEKQHHMACGKLRKSYTKKDKDFFENLYTYFSFVVWVAFRRNYFECIQEELGRMFRSPAFNPNAIPVDDHEFKLAYELTKLKIKEITLVPSPIRKNRRPPIHSILNQRSPVLVALFPNSKESGSWLLDRRHSLLHGKKKQIVKEEQQPDSMESVILHVGIIGEMIAGFNQHTLQPFGDETEEEKDVPKATYQDDLLSDESRTECG